MDVLNVTAKKVDDTSIYALDYFPFNPIQGTQYNTPGIIQIDIQNQDEYFLPHKSWLQFDLVFEKSTDLRWAGTENVTLVNNAVMYLFQNIKYLLGGNEIESLNHPGQATTMLGLLKYDKSYSGLSECWALDTNDTIAANDGFAKRKAYILALDPPNKGTVSFAVDLEHISGFAEDYDKVIFGQRQSLQFNRKANSDDAIYRDGDVAGKVDIKKITWWMARVKPSVIEETRLGQLNLAKEQAIDLWFRSRQCSTITVPVGTSSYTWNLGVKVERPRFLVVGFQTAHTGQDKNNGLFDHCNVTNMKVRINSAEFPTIDVNSNFDLNQYGGWYRRFMDFKRSFYGVDKMVSCTAVDIKAYMDLYPLYVFDASRQVETQGNSSILDISVKMNFNDTIDADTQAFALVISDRKLKIEVGGKRSVVVF